MGNKIRIKQIDLQGFLSGSGQVDLLSASNYVSFVTQLDATMSSDSELAAVSSSISQSVYTIRQTLGSGLVSGSTQLTSSFDTRYTLSGSIPNIPTGSFATTGSNTFSGNQIISGSVGISANSGSWNFLQNGTLVLPNGTGIYGNGLLQIDVVGGFLLTSYTDQFGSGSQEWYFHSDGTLNVPGNIEGADNLLTTASFNTFTQSYYSTSASFDSRIESLENETSSYLTSLDGAISSSTQISDLGFVTGSYTTINSFNSLTQSFNSISQSFNVISGSVVSIQDGFDTGSYQTFTASVNTSISNLNSATSSYETKGSGILSGSSQLNNTSIENLTIINLTTVNETASVIFSSGSNRFGDFGNDIHSFTGSVQVSGSTIITGSVSATSFNGTLNSTNGVISGSSQLTSSFDTRYTLSGSVQPLPNGLISGSSQLTSSFDTRYVASGSISAVPAGTISGSSQLTSSFDTRYAASGSVSSNINTGSFATTGSNSFNGNQTITGSLVVSAVAVVNGGITIPTGSVISLTSGSSLFVDAWGAITGSLTGSVFGIGDVVAFSASVNSRIISGSSVAGTISGSSQLTSSYDSRYLVTGSVTSSITQLNSFTSSINSKTGSFATTGSNSFNGSQQITGSLVVSQNITGSASASFISLAINTTTPTQKIHLKGATGIENGTTGGSTADQMIFGYVGSNLTQYTHRIQTGHDAQAALNRMDFLIANAASTWKTPLQLRHDRVIVSGSTYVSGDLIVTGSINGTINATNGVLSGSTQITPLLPAGTISGSSQLTSSYDSRYLTIGGDSVISGSSQLTSSFDTRYAISASFVSSSNVASIQTITSASYAALTPVSGTLYIIIG